jgi:diacylglycerol kinase family enzyme/membrane-associated phospholipid phosphatase
MRRITTWLNTTDQRVLAWVATRTSPVLDTTLPALGRAANYGRLWQAIALGLALIGNKHVRRAALRGLIALSIASFTANVISKRLTRRPRPATDVIPLIRRLTTAPRTTSFPSGHSASAAAFATAVAMEAPPLVAVPVAGLATAVAASRVVTGAHYPSDVLAGAALGGTAAALTRTWWPVRSPALAKATPAHGLPDAPTGTGLVIVVNPGAGSAQDVDETLRAELPDADIVVLTDGADVDHELHEAAKRATILGVVGGDGTINTAARHALAHQLPLLVFPGGTLNHFARELHLETVGDAVRALREGTAVRVDVGKAGDEIFLNTCSIGLYADLVRFRQRWEPRVGKWPAMLLGLRHVLRRGQPVEVHVDGRPRKLWMLFAGNDPYLPHGFTPAYRPSLVDGRLDLRVIDAVGEHALARLGFAALTRTLRWTRGYEATNPTRVRIVAPDCDRLDLTVDGELKHVPNDVVIEIEPEALVVYRPGV